MKLIQIDGREFNCPTNWVECTQRQLHELAYFSVLARAVDTFSPWDKILPIFLVSEPDSDFRRWWKGLKMHPDQFILLKNELKWIHDERLVIKPYESVTVKSVNYLLPDSDIEKYSMLEIAMAGIYLNESANAIEDGDVQDNIEALTKFMAVWLRPKEHWTKLVRLKRDRNWNGDVRQVFIDSTLHKREKILKHLGTKKKLIILRYLQDVFIDFIEDYSDIFGESSRKSEPRYQDGRGWLFVTKQLVKQNYFRSIEEAHRASAAWIFGLIRDDALDAKALGNPSK